ncbi:MAG: hypothetical protein ACMUIA_10115 [bacterium]
MVRVCLFLVIFLLIFLIPDTAQAAPAPNIRATGGWTETIDGSDLQSPWTAGSNLVNTYESVVNATSLNVIFNSYWRVDIRRSDGNWHGNFTLRARRSGGSYLEVTPTDASFFCGYKTSNNVQVQYQLSGMSVNISPATYWTTVVYTIVEITAGECP